MTDPWNIGRFIFECEPQNFIFAVKAANWLRERPGQKDAILAYGRGKDEVAFYVKHNKSSISVRQNHTP